MTQMHPDVQEALSRKYANSAYIVLPLVSGKFAVFDNTYSLQGIYPAEDLLRALPYRDPFSRYGDRPDPGKLNLDEFLKELEL